MANLIDKDALVAEINRQQRKLCLLDQSREVELRKSAAIQNGVYCRLLSFLDTLEVKEVDLEKEIEQYVSNKGLRDYGFLIPSIAKHFFELGMAVSNKV